jgi:hypothetical protein
MDAGDPALNEGSSAQIFGELNREEARATDVCRMERAEAAIS